MTLSENFEMFGLTLKAEPYGKDTQYRIFEGDECICTVYNEAQAQIFLVGFIRGTTQGKAVYATA